MTRRQTGNRLLDLLPAAEFAQLEPHLTEVKLDQGHVVYRAGEVIAEVYFPVDCVLSAVALMLDGSGVEIGNVGLEGVGGIQTALSVNRIPSEMICQVSGRALRVSASAFADSVERLERLRVLVQRYIQSFMNLVGQSVACNRLHNLSQRSARWLLMTRDRVGRDDFHLTHEFLAYMLGVRRSGVTVAAGTLSQAGLITYRRGQITILDGAGLEAAACECYQLIVDDFERVFAISESERREDNGAAR